MPRGVRRLPRQLRWLALGLALLVVPFPRAETWTNRAGHTLTAQCVGVEGQQVLLRFANGRVRRIPLASLKPADQARALAQSDAEPLPSELRAILEQAAADLERTTRFLQDGRITREDFDAQHAWLGERLIRLGRQILIDRGEPPDPARLARFAQRLDRPGSPPASAPSP